MPDRRDQPFAERQSPATTDSTDPTNPTPSRREEATGAREEEARGEGSGAGADGSGTGGAPGTPSGEAGPGADEGPDRAPADDNPFAPPPEGRPDQPWRPRRPADGSSPWGSQWSSRQPGAGQGDFGNRPEDPERGSGPGPGPGQNPPPGPTLRWDPTDPAQRRARYALLSGMWAFFFALFDMTEIALLLGSLALYWAISSLRAKPKPPETTPAHPASAPPAPPAKPQTTAAVTGLVTAILSLSIVAATFTMQLVYRDYYTCVDDALTKTGSLACNDLLPKPLEPLFGVKE
ncbi:MULTISPECIES: hypothetical protein [unclassified Streptomyces]|uniref:Integral membrane protein n=1 Tax=Streptomyces sp. NBC_00060 TaxID=2975636 RepID=A0AAU2H1C4_9ACTN